MKKNMALYLEVLLGNYELYYTTSLASALGGNIPPQMAQGTRYNIYDILLCTNLVCLSVLAKFMISFAIQRFFDY